MVFVAIFFSFSFLFWLALWKKVFISWAAILNMPLFPLFFFFGLIAPGLEASSRPARVARASGLCARCAHGLLASYARAARDVRGLGEHCLWCKTGAG